MRAAWMQYPAERRPQFVRPIKLDFTKLNLNLVEKIEFDCQGSVVGASRPPAIPRRFAVQVLLAARGRWISRAEHVDGNMSCISPRCRRSFYCCHRGALGRLG